MINFHSILGGFIPKKVEMVPNAKGIGPDFLAVFQLTSAAFVSSQNQEASEHSNLALERGSHKDPVGLEPKNTKRECI